ncbi:hypothetical protein [Isoptericola sp. BMS4]|uniref:hypothetical protein n=1 Tax=Isoptericola sp. BMS4 TaxID=2527875 RepID=UPI00196AB256|nr:hypothetical protein [Isoptericola sp. BMS4]
MDHSLVTDYFAAPNDAVAATVVRLEQGPSVVARGSGVPLFDTVRLPGIDPFVMLGRLAELVCRLPYARVTAHPRHGSLVQGSTDAGPWVVTISEEVAGALAAASPRLLTTVAQDWPRVAGAAAAAPETLAPALVALGDLAGRAGQARHALYCWLWLAPDAGGPSGAPTEVTTVRQG